MGTIQKQGRITQSASAMRHFALVNVLCTIDRGGRWHLFAACRNAMVSLSRLAAMLWYPFRGLPQCTAARFTSPVSDDLYVSKRLCLRSQCQQRFPRSCFFGWLRGCGRSERQFQTTRILPNSQSWIKKPSIHLQLRHLLLFYEVMMFGIE